MKHLEDIIKYVIGEDESIPDWSNTLLEYCATKTFEVCKNSLGWFTEDNDDWFDVSAIQYTGLQIDYCATMNDVLVACNKQEQQDIINALIYQQENDWNSII